MTRILIVLTSQGKVGNTEKDTGFHFSEFSHPYEFFVKHGFEVTVASPLGGECPITSPHPEDKINALFYSNPEKMKVIRETVKLGDILNEHYDAVFIAGGHGPMFDLANNKELAEIMNKTYSDGGVLGSVCHGPAAFVGVKDENGNYLVSGKRINSFTNNEEKATPYFDDMPFLLESKLIEQGAKFESSGPREPHLAVDQRLVTGQNPESIELVVGAMYALLQDKS
jgi:putative intracellular protease/amidase